MSEAAKKYHEEESIGKTYDLRVARRLVRYIKPYWKLAAAALVLTLLTNILISTQPYFTKMAVDDFITPKRVDGIWLFALAFFGVFLFRFIFSYVQEILVNNVGQRVMFDLRTELFTKLQCQSCHPTGNTMPPGKAPDELAPNLQLAAQRLRPDWVLQWLADPQKIFPGTRMPTFFPAGQQNPFPEILGGDSKKQIKAIRDHLFLTVGNGKRATSSGAIAK